MTELNDNQKVGVFFLMPAPLNPIKAFDAERFKKDVRTLMDSNPEIRFLAVDLRGIDFVYSDAFNAFAMYQQELGSRKGQFAVLADNETLIMTFKRAGLDRVFKLFVSEPEMIAFSNGDAPVVDVVERVTQRMAAVVSEYNQAEEVNVPPVVNRVAQAQNADYVPKFSTERTPVGPAVALKPVPPKPAPSALAPASSPVPPKPAPSALAPASSPVPPKPAKSVVTDAASAYSAFAEESSSTGKIVAILITVAIIIGVVVYFLL